MLKMVGKEKNHSFQDTFSDHLHTCAHTER